MLTHAFFLSSTAFSVAGASFVVPWSKLGSGSRAGSSPTRDGTDADARLGARSSLLGAERAGLTGLDGSLEVAADAAGAESGAAAGGESSWRARSTCGSGMVGGGLGAATAELSDSPVRAPTSDSRLEPDTNRIARIKLTPA